jgi:hypothetical protein
MHKLHISNESRCCMHLLDTPRENHFRDVQCVGISRLLNISPVIEACIASHAAYTCFDSLLDGLHRQNEQGHGDECITAYRLSWRLAGLVSASRASSACEPALLALRESALRL